MRSILESFSKKYFLTIFVIFIIALSNSVFASVSPVETMANIKPWVILAVMVFEYLIGKTKLVKANSTIELLENFVKQIFGIKQEDLKAF